MLQGYGCGSVPVSIEYPRLAKKILSRCEHSVNLAGARGFPRRLTTILSLFRQFYKIVKLFPPLFVRPCASFLLRGPLLGAAHGDGLGGDGQIPVPDTSGAVDGMGDGRPFQTFHQSFHSCHGKFCRDFFVLY